MIGKGRHRMFPLSKWKKYQLRRRKRKELSVEWIWWCGNTHSDFSTVANASDYFTSLFSQLFRPMIILKLVRLFSGLSLASECFLGRKAKEGLSRGDLSGSASTSSVNSLRARAAAAVRRRKKKILETLRCCFHPWNRGLFRPLPFPAPSSRRLTTAHLEFPLTGPLSLLSFFNALVWPAGSLFPRPVPISLLYVSFRAVAAVNSNEKQQKLLLCISPKRVWDAARCPYNKRLVLWKWISISNPLSHHHRRHPGTPDMKPK